MDEERRLLSFQTEEPGQRFASTSLPFSPIYLPSRPSQNVFPIQPQLARRVEASVTHAVVVPLGQQLDLAVLPTKVGCMDRCVFIFRKNRKWLGKGSCMA